MKNTIFTLICLMFSAFLSAQVGIGTNSPNTASLLDFGTEPKGIVLSPIPDVTATSPTLGTIAFDGTTGSFRTYNGSWSTPIAGGVTGSSNTALDTNTQGVIIGAETSTTEGALILEANGFQKTLILPKVANAEFSIKNPTAGLMVYDTESDLVMVYNGSTWTSF